MKFQVSTKPLVDALNLGVINSNVTAFYMKSCLAQVTASRRELKINLEADRILTEVTLLGSGDSDEVCTMFVDCLLLKKLVSAFDSSVTAIEYVDGGLILHSGTSKFTLPQVLDSSEIELRRPTAESSEFWDSNKKEINKSDWKFIKDHQMYSIAMATLHPVYQRVWVGEEGDVLVGDVDGGLFTHSKKTELGKTCLLEDTIINLFNSLPENSKIAEMGNSYLVFVNTDGFQYCAEFQIINETDPGVGSYNSEMILSMMQKNQAEGVTLDTANFNKQLNQALLLSNYYKGPITISVSDGAVRLKNSGIDCELSASTEQLTGDYAVDFKIETLQSVVSNFDEPSITICPVKQEDQVVGLMFWSNSMEVVLASADEQR